ncbi:MAG TPA: response regulator transcription factor [Tepidisphaeraceae bacterium]
MKVLVVEDYPPLRDAVAEGLREAGFAVDVAADGNTGLWLATSNDYDVIVLDLMLPGMSGLTILERLRKAGRNTHVLILTAKDDTEDRVTGLEAGADDYLVKPFAFKELLARVRALIRRRYAAKNPVITVDDLEINTVARTVRRGDRRIELSPREYALLEFLALRTGEVVTRTDIWEHVYEFHATAESNVVDVLIGHIRRKLDAPGSSKLIHTRRGHGYVLGGDEN